MVMLGSSWTEVGDSVISAKEHAGFGTKADAEKFENQSEECYERGNCHEDLENYRTQ